MKARLKAAVCLALIFTTAFSAFLFQSARPAIACTMPTAVPTLFDLFHLSSLVVTAELTSVDIGRVVNEESNYKSVEVTRNLRVMKIHKGVPPKHLSYKQEEIRFNTREDSEPRRYVDSYGYQGFSGMAVGEKYLFFFQSEPGTRDYKPIDDSGVKWLSEHDLAVHEARLAELSGILRTANNKERNLTDWVMRLIDEPTTRWDGVFELHKSWLAANHRNTESDPAPAVILISIGRAEPFFKENLTDSQRQFISTLAFREIDDVIAKGEFLRTYGIASLAANWEKARLAEYALSFMPAEIESDRRKTAIVVDAVASLLDDKVVWDLASDFTTDDDPKVEEKITVKPLTVKKDDAASDEFRPDSIEPSDSDVTVELFNDQSEFRLVQPDRPSKVRAAVVQKLREEFGYLVANEFRRPEDEEDSEK